MGKGDIKKRINACVAQLPQREEIERVLLFGSQLHGDAGEKSDVDLLLELRRPINIGLFDLARIRQSLEEALEMEVDVTTPDALSKYIRDDVLQEAEVIYEK